MTSTSFNVGLKDEPRLSSRVLRPPGGGHTDIFGGDPEPPRGRRLAPNVPDQIEIGNKNDMPKHEANTNGQDASPVAQEPSQKAQEPSQNAQVPSQNAEIPSQNGKEAKQAEPARAEPAKRVRVPPGGFSSGLW